MYVYQSTTGVYRNSICKTLQRTNEGLGIDSFSISNLQPESCTFDVVVLPSGTATMGEDFLLDSITSITMNNSGSLNYYVPFTILDDTLIEASETIDLLIQNFSGDPGCTMGEDSMMTIKIIDNEYLSLTLDEALERDSSGNLIFLGELIQIEASNQCIDMNGDGGHELYVQDDSSAMMLYSETILLTSYLSQGTKLRAQGFLSESNGLPILLLEDLEDIGNGQFYYWDWLY